VLKPKLKHLRHPLRTLDVAKSMAVAHFEMRSFADRGDEEFAHDPRYNLQNVTAGFACRQDVDTDDTALLNRICAAYKATVEHPECARPAYRATGWWQQIRHRSLAPVRQALLKNDIAALSGMYRNFFRDPSSTGLTTVPYGMTRAYFGGKMTDLQRRIYLADTLYRLDYWKRETGGRFHLRDLAVPSIGNPFGVCLEGTLVSARSEFQHRCADRVVSLLPSKLSTVVEIGGGFGAMAYYLLRDQPKTKYCDFDVPESIAIATYYLVKAFPHKKFLLFGETPLNVEAIANADVVLMPLFFLERLQTASVDVTFSSHAMTDIEAGELALYLETIHRVTRNRFLFVGAASLPNLPGLLGDGAGLFHLEERRQLHWSGHRLPQSGETEELYSFNRAEEKASSAEGNLAHAHR
jgi:putative sugar O-methyltransferase